MKKLMLMVFIAMLFAFPVSAEKTADDIYKEQYNASGADELYNALPDDAKQYFNSGPDSTEWLKNFTYDNVFTLIFEFIKGAWKKPFASISVSLALIILSAAVSAVSPDEAFSKTVSFITVLSVAASVIVPVCSLINTVGNTVKGCAVFMSSFIPVYIGITTVSGFALSGAIAGGMLLAAAEGTGALVSFGITPVVSSCLALGISGAVSPLSGGKLLSESLKKVAVWVLSTVSALFAGILSVQTTVSAAADKMSLKTAKLFASSVVPVVGSAVGESMTTVATCFSVLKTSVGAFGIIALGCIFIPVILQILLWRAALIFLSFTAESLGLKSVADAIHSVDAALSLMTATVIILCLLFIVSLTVVVLTGGGI